MSLFSAAAGPADRTIDKVFAGRITVTPVVADQDLGARPDPDRPPFDLFAPFVSRDELQSLEGARSEESFIGRVAGGAFWLSVRMDDLAGRRLSQGDKIIVHDRPAGDRSFEVAHVGVIEAGGRQKFYLTRISE